MSTLRELSVIEDTLWKKAQGIDSNYNAYNTNLGFGLVIISPDENSIVNKKKTAKDFPVIQGILLEPFSYSIDSTWSGITTPFDEGFSSLVNDSLIATGQGDITSTWTSKLYWRQSGYIKSTIKFRVIDDYGKGTPMATVASLLLYVSSSYSENGLSDTINDKIRKWEEKLPDPIKKKINTFTSDISSLLVPKEAPPLVRLEIARVFRRADLAVTGLDFSYSREYTDAGPLYVDVTMSVSSRTIIRDYKDTGVNFNQPQDRVNIQNNTPKVEKQSVPEVTTPKEDSNDVSGPSPAQRRLRLGHPHSS